MRGGGVASGVYGVLLRLLPVELRRRHGAEMRASFEERVSEARAGGVGSTLAAVVSGYWDVLRRSMYERGRRSLPGPGVAASLGSDVRFALRTFVRRPGTTLMAVVMLSLGAAASGAVFTLVEGLFLRPLPLPAPDRLVYVDETAPKWNLESVGVSFADFHVWREGQQAFEALGLINSGSYNLSTEAGVERVDGAQVTYDLAAAMGVEPVVGRLFTAEDDRPGAAPVALLGHDLWQRAYGGSPDVIGETVRLNSRAHTVVGVLPPEASFPTAVDLWTPLAADPTTRGSYSYGGIGRLKAGVTVEAAETDLRRAHQPIWEEYDEGRVVSPIVMPLRDRLVGELKAPAAALAVAVGLVLLIACGNVAALLLARSFARRRELGIRVALGAGSGRIARQLFAESLALALVASPLGLTLGFWLVRLLSMNLPEGLPPWIALEPSWRTALFGLGLVVATTVFFGWAPVVQARRNEVRASLTEGGGRAGVSRFQRRTMDGLVVAEVTLAALLLVTGGLLVRGFQQLQTVDPGFRTENVVSFRVALPEATYPDSAARATFYHRLLAGLAAIPGVQSAGGIDCPPFGCHTGGFFAAEGGLGMDEDDANPVVLHRQATPGYFRTLGIRAVSGRLLGPDDDRPGRRTVVINETFARTFFGETDPVGRRIVRRGLDFAEDGWRVVGVAADVKHYGMGEPMRPALYFSNDASPARSLALFLWTSADPTAAIPMARERLADLDPELPLYQAQTVERQVRESLALQRATTWAMVVFAGLALVLALGGIYGVLSYLVGQRSREIGVRVALGATRGSVLGLVLRHGLVLAVVGTALGLGAAAAAARAMEGAMVGFPGFDPLAFSATAVLLIGAGLVASALPARRALAVDAGAALREE